MMNNLLTSLFSLCLIGAGFSGATFAAEAKKKGVSSHGPVSEVELDTYLNEFMQQKMSGSKTPGAAIWLYQQNRLDVGRAYGVSNIAQGKVVSAEDTVFRIASVSKVFVAIAALQQVEQGKLDLDTDINEYLSLFKVPAYQGRPLTMRQLLVHTSGIESRFWGDSSISAEETESLGEHLARRLPARVMEPGFVISYSNYGSALAAYVVEETSGELFSDYVKQHILLPAGMTSSGYLLDQQLAEKLATGYEGNGDVIEARPYTWLHRYPPTSMLSTAKDMGLLIKMLLNDGLGISGQVLSSDSVKELFKQQFTHDPDLPGMALAFMEMYQHGKKILWHDGATVGFQAELVILPEENAGYFIATNFKGNAFSGELRVGLLERFYNAQPEPVMQPIIGLGSIERFAGNYAHNRVNHTTFESFLTLTRAGQDISIDEEGFLTLWDHRYNPVGELKFQREDGKRLLVFAENGQGEIDYLYIDWGGAPRALKKRSVFELREIQAGILVLSLLIAVVLSVVLISRFVRKSVLVKPGEKLALINSLLPLVFMALFIMGFLTTKGGLEVRLADIPMLMVALAVPLMLLVSTGFSLTQLAMGKIKQSSVISSVAVANSVVFLLWLNHWNLLGYFL